MINESVFKAYDVRGLYPSEINEDLFHQLGRAFIAYLGPGKYAVCRDMRTSSPSLTKAFIDGALKQGGQLIDYGLIGTDQMYYAVAADKLDGGAMITASRFANSLGVFAGIVEIAVVGYILVKAMALIRRRLLLWHPEASDPSTV